MAVVLAVKFTVPVVHVVFGFELAVTVGNWFTVTSTVVIVDVQPVKVLVPVTVYVVLLVGLQWLYSCCLWLTMYRYLLHWRLVLRLCLHRWWHWRLLLVGVG